MPKYTTFTSGAFVEEFAISPYQSGCLNGLSFAVKDCMDIKNKVTGFGNPTWLDTHPPAVAHALCVELLLSQGAICAGKTVTDELTYSLVGENFFYGTPINPRCPDRVPGGSSSGSASSVACGLVDFALGTDTGGSIRVPASNCGIYGYRPTHGRIPTAGVLPLAPSLDTVGILAKDSATLKSVASTLLGLDFSNHVACHKIVLVEDVLTACEPNVQKAVLEYLDQHCSYSTIQLANITSKEVTLNWLRDLYVLLHSAEVWSVHGAWVESLKPKLGPITDYNLNQIAKVANRQMLGEGVKTREWFAKTLQKYLQDDVVLCFPTAPDIAPQKGVYSQRPEARRSGGYFQKLIGINAIAGLSRSPQITVPISDTKGMPIGISFLAGQNQDEWLFQVISQTRDTI